MGQYCTPCTSWLLISRSRRSRTCRAVNGPPVNFVTSGSPHSSRATETSACVQMLNPSRGERRKYSLTAITRAIRFLFQLSLSAAWNDTSPHILERPWLRHQATRPSEGHSENE